MAPASPAPTPFVLIREQRGQPLYDAKFRYAGRQVKRRIDPHG